MPYALLLQHGTLIDPAQQLHDVALQTRRLRRRVLVVEILGGVMEVIHHRPDDAKPEEESQVRRDPEYLPDDQR